MRLSLGSLALLLVASCRGAPETPEEVLSGNTRDDVPDAARPPAPAPDDGDGDVIDPPPADGDDGVGEPAPAPLRFVVLGDGGTGTTDQFAVADAIAKVCAERGCSFALYTGDAIYEVGVTSVDDVQFETKFEAPYAVLDFPFYMALGNHDYGSSNSNFDPEMDRTRLQVEYTERSDKWRLPHQYYTEHLGVAQIFAIDTNAIILDAFRTGSEQAAWLEAELEASDAPWKLVFGHHPYVSNGMHGNARDPDLLSMMEDTLCGRATVYFAGHDHDREWLEPTCGTHFIISGAASQLRRMYGTEQPTRWQDGTKLGFLWVEIAGNTLRGVFYDVEGKVDYEDTITLPQP